VALGLQGKVVIVIGSGRGIGDALLFLASERAGFITGEVLHVTGGRSSN
jgi:3-oxoacyl-[acyl-carrier protein] reductase